MAVTFFDLTFRESSSMIPTGPTQLPRKRIYPTDSLPNTQQIALAKADLLSDEAALERLQSLEEAAQAELDEKTKQVNERIAAYHVERNIIQNNKAAALSFIAPIRRMPLEIYREIFLIANAADPQGRIPFRVAAVCALWRRMALNIPNLWSHIRFHSHLGVSPDIIRIWVERSGPKVPLDIDIELSRRPKSAFPAWASASRVAHIHRRMSHGVMRLRNSPLPPPSSDDNAQGNATQWGHVALFYLTAQKHRWRRFVFESLEVPIEALQVLNGPFPILEEFSVHCGDNTCRPSSWQWFISQTGGENTPMLRKLNLDHVNFSWSSGVFSGLTSLRVHSPAPMVYHPHPATMDAVFTILVNNPHLQHLDLSVQALQNSVLPLLEEIELPELTHLSLEGAPHFIVLLQHLKLEKLECVNVRFDIPQSLDFGEAFRDLLTRSNRPPIRKLNVQQPYRTQENNLIYLDCLPELRELTVSRLPMEDVLIALDGTNPDGSLVCPNLTKLLLQNCPGRRDMDSIVPRLVRFVERRTDLAYSAIRRSLKSLRISNCGCMVTTVQEDWLRGRLTEFVIDEWPGCVYTPHADWDIFN